ncbi:MAG TPA: hypothetical protein DDY88_05095 [Actinobacteria bacterium]|nr:hypothetical protein [Actinomycetota bacterium]
MQALVLGTAQWGNAYGVTNSPGRLSDAAIAEIARIALESGISQVDTAGDYGDAEHRLAPWAARFSVTTKVKGSSAASVADQLGHSLGDLGLERLRCCLVHDWPSLTDDRAAQVAAELRELQQQGLVQRVGISAYDEADLRRARLLFDGLGAVQVPVSILDRRLDDSDVIAELVDAEVEIQARSVLLQGLLVGSTSSALGAHPDVLRFRSHCSDIGVEPRALALGFIRTLGWVSQVVLGVTSAEELSQITATWAESPEIDHEGFRGSSDLALIDPRLWA